MKPARPWCAHQWRGTQAKIRIDDGHTWLNHFPIRSRANHPLLFDRDFKPKPAFIEVLKLAKATTPAGDE